MLWFFFKIFGGRDFFLAFRFCGGFFGEIQVYGFSFESLEYFEYFRKIKFFSRAFEQLKALIKNCSFFIRKFLNIFWLCRRKVFLFF